MAQILEKNKITVFAFKGKVGDVHTRALNEAMNVANMLGSAGTEIESVSVEEDNDEVRYIIRTKETN